ncbi:MAG: tryptophan synthase subunit alpha [Bacteroidetes bacterium]|jgi:tryptophan synthase alpha chain|nr:tryptophan synthase subunit alpha [Phycisphaerae bacterium]NBB74538.1 tryptophan synthase subunit alpha [Bacteroidota bacterium]
MSALENNRIVQAFADLRAEGKTTLLPFLTAGYPDLIATAELLAEIEQQGARICELGIPFSDPVADGPTIQASFTAALEAGVTLAGVFDIVKQYREVGGKLGLLAMLSYSIVYRHGSEAFCAQAAEAGFDGLIVPDLPLEEAGRFAEIATAAGMCNVLLIAPTTPEDRKLEIARHCSGFVYYISVAGITGERKALPLETIESVRRLNDQIDTPVCVGFGISSGPMVAEVCKAADGAIVGSAIIHQITDAVNKGLDRAAMVDTVGHFVGELIKPVL